MEGSVFRAPNEAEERWWWTTVSIVLMMLLVGPAVRSPDGMEMLRITASWLGADVQVGDPHFWPPLWSLLNVPAVLLGDPVTGARWLNLMLWGAIAWPLHSAVATIGGRSAARWAVLLYWCLPMLSLFASVLDARALGAFITTSFVAALIHTARRGHGLAWPVFWAALAPFARPEGILLGAVAMFAFWLMGRGWRQVLGSALLMFGPTTAFQGSVRGMTGHEQLFAPWYGTWSTWDILTLFGPASVPTEFRRFALAAMDTGVVKARPSVEDFLGVLAAVPGGVLGGLMALGGAVGVLGLIAAATGLMRHLPARRRLGVAAAVLGPFLVIAAAPMAKDQAGPLSNYLFLMPTLIGLLALGVTVLRRWAWAPWVALLVIVAETNFTPLMTPAPYFLEGSESAALATVMLKRNPPASGQVATDFSGRDVVMGAGLSVRPLGPIWVGPVPSDVDAILINSVGASGEDGGRTLSLLESDAWQVAWVVGDGDLEMSAGLPPQTPRWDQGGWYALLRPAGRR
jgi:hypothetical protein